MPSVYLESADYATYGVPNATADQIIKASAIIDGYLDRPDGLIYIVDMSNNPVAMAATNLPIEVFTNAGIKNRILLSNTPLVALLLVQYNDNYVSPTNWKTVTNNTFNKNGFVFLDQQVPDLSDLQINYIGGWLYSTLPYVIKQACANLVQLFSENIVTGNVQSYRAGDTEIVFGKGVQQYGYLDASTRQMLEPYRRVFVE